MKAWGGRDRSPADRASSADRDETIKALDDAGIDLDPETPAGRHHHVGPDHDHPDGEHDDASGEHDHPHPHPHSSADEAPVIGIVGAGAVGTALGVALSRAGWPVQAVASRDAGRRERFRQLVPGARGFAEPAGLVEEVELIVLAVPDDVIPRVAGSVRMYSGQAMIHTSGLLGAEALGGAMAAGTQVGSFHPLVAFADIERAVKALHGATIAIEGDEQLLDLLGRMAEAIGGIPVRLAPGAKPAYHAAAVLAAGGFVALLDAIAELGRVAGLDEAGSLAIYGPLIEQTLGNARTLGIRSALTGPMTRGDTGTVERHLAALKAHAPGVLDLYRAAAEREVVLAEARGVLTTQSAERLRAIIAGALATTV